MTPDEMAANLTTDIANVIYAAIAAERERIAIMVDRSEVFCEHGCTDRIARLIRDT